MFTVETQATKYVRSLLLISAHERVHMNSERKARPRKLKRVTSQRVDPTRRVKPT